MFDFLLAIIHHLLVFLLTGLLAAEFALLRGELTSANLMRLSRIDALYGATSVGVIAIGVVRVLYGVRGWEYYVYYPIFWMKMGAFVAIALLSIVPTLRILSWRRRSAIEPFDPPAQEIAAVRHFLHAELGCVVLVLIFAAAMARGIGN